MLDINNSQNWLTAYLKQRKECSIRNWLTDSYNSYRGSAGYRWKKIKIANQLLPSIKNIGNNPNISELMSLLWNVDKAYQANYQLYQKNPKLGQGSLGIQLKALRNNILNSIIKKLDHDFSNTDAQFTTIPQKIRYLRLLAIVEKLKDQEPIPNEKILQYQLTAENLKLNLQQLSLWDPTLDLLGNSKEISQELTKLEQTSYERNYHYFLVEHLKAVHNGKTTTLLSEQQLQRLSTKIVYRDTIKEAIKLTELEFLIDRQIQVDKRKDEPVTTLGEQTDRNILLQELDALFKKIREWLTTDRPVLAATRTFEIESGYKINSQSIKEFIETHADERIDDSFVLHSEMHSSATRTIKDERVKPYDLASYLYKLPNTIKEMSANKVYYAENHTSLQKLIKRICKEFEIDLEYLQKFSLLLSSYKDQTKQALANKSASSAPRTALEIQVAKSNIQELNRLIVDLLLKENSPFDTQPLMSMMAKIPSQKWVSLVRSCIVRCEHFASFSTALSYQEAAEFSPKIEPELDFNGPYFSSSKSC